MIGALAPKLAPLVKFSPISPRRLRMFPCFVDTARRTRGSQFGAQAGRHARKGQENGGESRGSDGKISL